MSVEHTAKEKNEKDPREHSQHCSAHNSGCRCSCAPNMVRDGNAYATLNSAKHTRQACLHISKSPGIPGESNRRIRCKRTLHTFKVRSSAGRQSMSVLRRS